MSTYKLLINVLITVNYFLFLLTRVLFSVLTLKVPLKINES